MIDDTRQQKHGRQGPTMPWNALRLSDNVDEIMKHCVTREQTQQWVSSLRFLTFDDTDRQALRGQCLSCEQRRPPPPGHRCADHTSFMSESHAAEREIELSAYNNPCVHIVEKSCDACEHIPLFPNEGKVTRFRLRKVYKPDCDLMRLCDHFVAVSYSWSSEEGSAAEPYTVTEEDGTTRPLRAQNGTIDRAVNFARENGYRMIWIDQECLDQSNKREKEVAIQSMDLVYLKADQCIGLIHSKPNQGNLRCLAMIYEKTSGFNRRTTRQARPALTRNSHLTLNKKLVLETASLILDDKWNTRAWVMQEAFVSNSRMTLLFPRAENLNFDGWPLICHEKSRSEVAIRLEALQVCLTAFRRWLTSSRSLLQKVTLFHPQQPENTSFLAINDQKHQRRTCNAATAVAYLRHRDLSRVADKLAIVANLCGYSLRLNTTDLVKSQPSLALCILALAVANGDHSLLVPQMYNVPKSANRQGTARNVHVEFSWAHYMKHSLQYLRAASFNPTGNAEGKLIQTWVQLSGEGLKLLGNLWNIDRFISLERVQKQYASSWLKIRQTKKPVKPSADTRRRATTHMLFEILESLRDLGETHVANSILNSTIEWRWLNPDKTGFFPTCIESVDDLPVGLKLENRKDLFRLTPSTNGWFHECWLVDRVMKKGGLWAASLSSTDRSPTSKATAPQKDISAEAVLEDVEADSLTPGKAATEMPRTTIASHAKLMTTLSTITKLGDHAGRVQRLKDTSDMHNDSMDWGALITGQSMSLFALQASRLTGTGEFDTNLHGRCAVFNVDGDLTRIKQVLTPFQMIYESIPRPEIRNLSISWAVKRSNREVKGADESFTVSDTVQGMWPFTSTYTGSYNVH